MPDRPSTLDSSTIHAQSWAILQHDGHGDFGKAPRDRRALRQAHSYIDVPATVIGHGGRVERVVLRPSDHLVALDPRQFPGPQSRRAHVSNNDGVDAGRNIPVEHQLRPRTPDRFRGWAGTDNADIIGDVGVVVDSVDVCGVAWAGFGGGDVQADALAGAERAGTATITFLSPAAAFQIRHQATAHNERRAARAKFEGASH